MGNKEIEINDNTPAGKVKKKSLFKRICRFFAWFVGILVAIVLLLFCGIAWILTPERLTPMVEKIVGENITADFSLGKAELSVWGTFPRLQLDIDSLVIVNYVFDALPPEELAKLPAYSDTLLKIGRFSGSVNIPALFIGKIRLTDVILGATAINIVSYDRNKCNFNIFPERQPDNAESGSVSLPDISIDRLRIVGDMPIRYVSIVDSVDVELRLLESDVMTECNPGYKLAVSSSLNAMLPPEINVDSINIGLDGRIDWRHDNPMDVRLNDFSINIGEIDSKFSAEIDFNEPSQVKSFVLSIAHVSPMEVLEMLPKQLKTSLEDIETDMAISSDVKLLMPYCIGDTSLPSVEVVIDVPRCSIRYGQYYIKELELNANATIDGHDLNKSKLNVTRFHAGIDGADIDFEGFVTSVFNDFYADGKIRAVVELVDLPKAVKNEIAGSISGNISLDAAARFYKNDLSLNGFHKIFLDGNLELRDIDVSLPELNMKFYTGLTHFDLGTNNKFVSDASRIDSLLTASVKTDTLSFSSEGITLQGKNLRAGIGCSNKGLPKDTLTVIPLGATIYAKELSYNGDDTTIMRLRDIYAFTTLSRFNNDAYAPLFRFQAGMKRAFYADRMNRLLLNNGSLDLKAHLRPVGKVEKRLKERYDSIAKANPGLSQDSLIALYKNNFPRKMRNSSAEYMDFGLDNSTKRILMKWDVSGNIKAEHGGLFTPYFPLRNRLSNFNVAFSMDSIVFKDVSYKVGHSDFLINGAIKNIRRALAFKFPLKAELHLSSDSLNINELVQASYKGSAFAGRLWTDL